MAAKKTIGDDENLTRQVGIRLTAENYERIERLSGTLPVSAIIRAALLVGLDVIEAQPGVLLGEKVKLKH
jgi:hypothetical protein